LKRHLFALLGALISTQVAAQSELESLRNLSEELVTIRQQIETLHSEIGFEKEAYRDRLRSLSNQKSDLEVKLSRADLNIKDLQRELSKLTEINRQKNESHTKITPVLEQAISSLRSDIEVSLPFKRVERLQALDDIEHRLKTGLISPNKAANQLWAFVEDELVLGRSSGIYNDTLELEGQMKLVKVLRVGKIALFYRTQDESYGVLRRQGERWQQQAIQDELQVAQLDHLFDSFTKNIRTGLFTVPNFLPGN